MIANAVIHGRSVPTELLGELNNSTPLLAEPVKLRAAFERDGYAFFRGVLDRDVVQAARQEVLSRLEAIDEVEPGSPTAWQRDAPSASAGHADRGEFWRSVSTGESCANCPTAQGIRGVLTTLIGEEVVPFDYLMLRVATRVGLRKSTTIIRSSLVSTTRCAPSGPQSATFRSSAARCS